MENWTPEQWISLSVALATMVAAILGAVGSFLAKLRADSNDVKIDENTALTKAGTDAAATNAKVAANTAAEAKTVAEAVHSKLNGGLDERMKAIANEALIPIIKSMQEHQDQDEKNMLEIRNAIIDFKASITNAKSV